VKGEIRNVKKKRTGRENKRTKLGKGRRAFFASRSGKRPIHGPSASGQEKAEEKERFLATSL